MKNIYSLLACCIVSLVLLQYRVAHSDLLSDIPLKVTTWDAFGYYMYLPSAFIYNDFTELEWLPEMDSKYALTGGDLYQANKYENGNYVFKYLGGVAILEVPFFLLGHFIALNTEYPPDGFSPPYQYAIAFGAVFFCILALFLLRKILLRYFSDLSVAISLFLMVLATNLIQYVSIDSAMSHAWIFPLYVLVMYTTIKWHEKPNTLWASLTGLIIGLATICRPTEAIMLFIPLLWNTHTKDAAKAKWALVWKYRSQLFFLALFGLIGILPQLIYWKMASGSFVYNVGSKWVFLKPWFRVLVGFENGWFIYTPITIFFVLGFFYIKNFPFRKSVITFCLLNIWIVISWFDWKYGATYSTRALVQSYPIFALPFTAFIERVNLKKLRLLFYALGAFLIYVNIFQLHQYKNTILHYRDMNRKYYSRIYLNPQPDALDMSLMDTPDVLDDESKFKVIELMRFDSMEIGFRPESPYVFADLEIPPSHRNQNESETWVKVESKIQIEEGFYGSFLNLDLQSEDSLLQRKIRLFNPISTPGKINEYVFYTKIPELKNLGAGKVYITSENNFKGRVELLSVSFLER